MRGKIYLGFGGLCLLSASGWIVDQYAPALLPGLLGQAVRAGVLCAIFVVGGIVVSGRRRSSPGVRVRLEIGGWAAVLLVLPRLLFAGAGGLVSGLSEVLVFTLAPLVVVFAEAQREMGFGAGESPLRRMAPMLAGVAGAAMLIPFTLPPSASGKLWLAGMMVSAGLGGYAALRMHRVSAGVGLLETAAVVCGACAVAAGAGAAVFWRVGWTAAGVQTGVGAGSGAGAVQGSAIAVEIGRCLLLDGPVLLLTVWLLREMEPVAFSSRYLVVPLLTVAEGYVLLRPETNWTMVVGGLLLAGGCAMLLADRDANRGDTGTR